jgi:hypothetical protein
VHPIGSERVASQVADLFVLFFGFVCMFNTYYNGHTSRIILSLSGEVRNSVESRCTFDFLLVIIMRVCASKRNVAEAVEEGISCTAVPERQQPTGPILGLS